MSEPNLCACGQIALYRAGDRFYCKQCRQQAIDATKALKRGVDSHQSVKAWQYKTEWVA